MSKFGMVYMRPIERKKKKKKKRVPETYYRVLADDSLQFFIANFVLLFPQR